MSKNIGLNWFQSVSLFGCDDDYFVSPISAMIEADEEILQ